MCALLCWASTTAPAAAAAATATGKYFVIVSGIDEAKGVTSGITPELKQLFADELKRHAEFILERPKDMPTDPEQLVDWLKAHKLKAFEVSLKVLSVTRELKPPPPGKQYRVLVRGIKLSVFGDTLPEKVMAIGGDGESEVGAEVGRASDVDAEGKKLLLECAKVAVTQAVDMTVAKLNLADKPVKVKRKPVTPAPAKKPAAH
jgi:hypothetical protein